MVSTSAGTLSASRVGFETNVSSNQDIEPDTVAHKYPTSPRVAAKVTMATTNRMPASVTMRTPYCVQRLDPASAPRVVACMQKPASPPASNATLSQRNSVNTCDAHSGAVPTIRTAEAIAKADAILTGKVVASGERSRCASDSRTSRVVSCSSPLAAPVTKPNAPQKTPNTENNAGPSSRAARYSTAYPQIALTAVAAPMRATLERVLGPASVTSGPRAGAASRRAMPSTAGAGIHRSTRRPGR
ncbi:Uncharacterised protein [Mycobacteroides abscessus subsp. abscessus]|nr:Uncharacterised protein [Mycobacteroides abscessus subsp. abscessus]